MGKFKVFCKETKFLTSSYPEDLRTEAVPDSIVEESTKVVTVPTSLKHNNAFLWGSIF